MSDWQEVTGEFGKSIRWTEQPVREWEKENSIYVGKEVHGILDDVRKNIGENNANIYEIFTAEYGQVSVWDTTVLADKMKKVLVGSEVKIIYEGEVKPKSGGKAYKQFRVLHRETPDPEFVKVIDGLRAKEANADGAQEIADAVGGEIVQQVLILPLVRVNEIPTRACESIKNKNMFQIYNEKEVEQLADKYIKTLSEKIKSDIADDIYRNLSDYLYEHYRNFKDKVKTDLINDIVEEFVKNPKDYKFYKLRERLFNDNKELLIKTLTDEAIEKSVEDVIEEYTHRNYHFNWKWKDAIVKIILNNWDKFKDDERIKEQFGRELERKNEWIKCLENQLSEIRSIAE